MIEILSCNTRFGLSPFYFVKTLNILRQKGIKFMVLEGKIGMLSAVGIDINETDSLKWISKNQIDYENNKVHQADIFIDGSDFIYIINHESMWDTGAKIELGIISDNPAVGKRNFTNMLSK